MKCRCHLMMHIEGNMATMWTVEHMLHDNKKIIYLWVLVTYRSLRMTFGWLTVGVPIA